MTERTFELIDERAGCALWKQDDGKWTVTGISKPNHEALLRDAGRPIEPRWTVVWAVGILCGRIGRSVDSESNARRVFRRLLAEHEEDD